LDETSLTEVEEEVHLIGKFEEEEYKSEFEMESEDEEDSLPVMCTMQTQARMKTTATKGTSRALASQGGSSLKKA